MYLLSRGFSNDNGYRDSIKTRLGMLGGSSHNSANIRRRPLLNALQPSSRKITPAKIRPMRKPVEYALPTLDRSPMAAANTQKLPHNRRSAPRVASSMPMTCFISKVLDGGGAVLQLIGVVWALNIIAALAGER